MGPLHEAPQGSSSSQKEKPSSSVKRADKNWQLSDPVQELLSSSKLEATMHDIFTEDGRERVCASHFTMQY